MRRHNTERPINRSGVVRGRCFQFFVAQVFDYSADVEH